MRVVKDLSCIKNEKNVFVQFGAAWCAPCKAMTSYIESDLEEKFGEVTFVKIDIEDCDQELLRTYQIRSVPKVIVFENGTAKESFIGFNKDKIINAIS